MPAPLSAERIRRARIERLIALAAPALDLVLEAGDRISRLAGGDDEQPPIRAPGESFELPARNPGRTR